jgi:single-stranded DNA-binding protein
MAYERITVVGNIGAVEVHVSQAGNTFIKLRVAVNRDRTRNSEPIWYNVFLFNHLASKPEQVQRLYTKGRLVLVEGRPQMEAFLRKDKTVGLDNTIMASAMPECLDKPPGT